MLRSYKFNHSRGDTVRMQLAVFGATGRTGRPLVEQPLERGHDVVAFARDPADLAGFDDPALTVVAGGAYAGDGISDAIAGANTIVSGLRRPGSGPDDLLTVAGDDVPAAMAAADVSRFVTLVGAGVREDGESVSLSGRAMGVLLKLLAKEVLADAGEHVERVTGSDTEWAVLRAPWLVDGDGTDEYRAGDVSLGFESVARRRRPLHPRRPRGRPVRSRAAEGGGATMSVPQADGVVLVTAATGTVGREVVRELASTGVPVRAASRDPEGAREGFESEWLDDDGDREFVEYVAFDFHKPETYYPALEGVESLFLVRPPDVGRVKRDVFPFVDAAERMGVEHAVVLSVLGAEKNPILPHRRIEKHVEDGGMAWTFLRASFFLQNLLEVHREDLVERDRVFLPAGDGETSFVDARDVGAVAAAAVQDPSLRDRAIDVTGAEALTYHEVAAVMMDVLDREVTYADPGLLEYARTEYRRGTPLPFVVIQLGVYATARFGLAGRVTDDVARVLGREPRSVREFVVDHADAFAPTDGEPKATAEDEATG
jgi:uncharacterized protein YbjT (DUF2867 family)